MARLTPDLCDDHPDVALAVAPLFRSFGGPAAFSGPIATVKVHEDNVLVREALAEPGAGRVLVVDGGGSLRCALVGGNLAALGAKNDWRGAVVYGCVRDLGELRAAAFGVLALAAHPVKSAKKGEGARDVAVTFGGVTFRPGEYLYADEDGIVVSARPLALPAAGAAAGLSGRRRPFARAGRPTLVAPLEGAVATAVAPDALFPPVAPQVAPHGEGVAPRRADGGEKRGGPAKRRRRRSRTGVHVADFPRGTFRRRPTPPSPGNALRAHVGTRRNVRSPFSVAT